MQKITFGAGCFWGVEKAFSKVKGVTHTEVGYMGGDVENPSYEEVCTGRTDHVEVCKVNYDESTVSFSELLKVFWDVHDPTHVDRQGVDVGTQYRSVIFYYTDEQKKEAEKSKKELEKSGKYSEPIATSIEKAEIFYRAEEYHQKYLDKKQESIVGQLMQKLKKG